MSDEEEEGLLREEVEKDSEGEGDSLGQESDDEEEEEEVVTAEDLKFIADDEEDSDDGVRPNIDRDAVKKRKRKPVEETLSDDDLELIQENIGQKKKLKRRDYDIQNMMEQEFDQSDDMNDFIIRDGSDDEKMEQSENLAVDLGISDAQWRDIDELFGTGDDYPHALGLEQEEFQKEITIKDVYEPSEIQAKMLTEGDELIRVRDIPERLQKFKLKMVIPDDAEIAREANVITKTYLGRIDMNEKTLNQAILSVLKLLRRDQFEVPFIYRHRRDYFDGVLELQDLWRIVDLDEKFIQVEQKKKQLMELIVQIASVDTAIETDEQVAHLVERIVTLDDVNDTFAHIHLKYSFQISQLQSTQTHRRQFKRAQWKVLYDSAVEHNIKNLADVFGIQISLFVDSVISRQSLHMPEDTFQSPIDAAHSYISEAFPTVDSVLGAARHLLAHEIAAHPQIRAFIRRVFQSDSVVSVSPTEKGRKEIEQHHPFYPFKYLTNKPVHKFNDGQFLQLMRGELDGLLEISIKVEEEEQLMADMHKFICNDFLSEVAELWNEQRKLVVNVAMKEVLFPQVVKWLKERLATQASELVALRCQNAMEQVYLTNKKINMQPFHHNDNDDEAPVVMAISWGDGLKNAPTYVVVLNENGEMIDFKKLEKMMDRDGKRDDGRTLVNMIETHKPHCVVVGGFKPNTKTNLMRTLQEEVIDVARGPDGNTLPLLLVDDECARIFMNSKRGLTEFPESDFPLLIRYLIALGRYVQEPTLEYAGLCNQDEDIKNVRLDTLQHLISDDLLQRAIERAFLNVVNKCGVDVNAAAAFPHLSHTLQFVSGLGPRKAQAIISKIIRSGGKLESRADLVQKLGIGATVFLNCASFIRIRDFHFLNVFQEQQLDVLDDTRVHPEDYALARKMAADALDLEDAVVEDDENPSVHVKDLMDGDVDKLNLLLLDDYAVELERRLHAPKRICLMDIKEELMHRYRDARLRFQTPGYEHMFMMLTGESRETLSEGSIVSCVVSRVRDRMLIVQLGSGVEGTVFNKEIDLPYDNVDLTGLFHENQALMAKVLTIHYDRMSVECTIRESEVQPGMHIQVRVDPHFDGERMRKDDQQKTMKKQTVQKQVRQIQHPYWQNINYKAAEKYLETRPRGEVVVRPSSSGKDHISITWKVDEGIYQHIDVLEQQKANEWTLGKRLVIEDQVFSEIDQIIAEYVEPMTRKIALLLDNPKYQRKSLAEMFIYLTEQANILGRSAYGFIICSEKPGSFFLVYKHPKNSSRQEIVRVRPSGYEFRSKRFNDINDLLAFFKHEEQAKAKAAQRQGGDGRRHGNAPWNNDPRDPRGSDPRGGDPRGGDPRDRQRDYDDRDRRGPQRGYQDSYGRGY